MSGHNIIHTGAVIQARMGSSRLAGKVLHKIAGKTVLEHVIGRLQQCKNVEEVFVATSVSAVDLPIVKLCAEKQVRVYCGSEEDVLDRYYQAARLFQIENIVRITADCPLHDYRVIDHIIEEHEKYGKDYTSNSYDPTYPDGLDTEVFRSDTLTKTWKEAKLASDREHVTQYMIHNEGISKYSVRNDADLSGERWTLDTAEDETFIQAIYARLYEQDPYFGMQDVLRILEQEPGLREINNMYSRNEGLEKSKKNDHIMIG